MAILRMDHVTVVVEDLAAAIAFFEAVGMELEGRGEVEGSWVDRITGLDGVRCEIAMLRTPDGLHKIELSRFVSPPATGTPGAVNALGLMNLMFAVDDLEDTLVRLEPHGAELVGEVVDYEGMYRLCYVRGPGGAMVALAEELGQS
jgi:catechol 2,3-dioxygenase-like lactoylglutathione lyase family enzyme